MKDAGLLKVWSCCSAWMNRLGLVFRVGTCCTYHGWILSGDDEQRMYYYWIDIIFRFYPSRTWKLSGLMGQSPRLDIKPTMGTKTIRIRRAHCLIQNPVLSLPYRQCMCLLDDLDGSCGCFILSHIFSASIAFQEKKAMRKVYIPHWPTFNRIQNVYSGNYRKKAFQTASNYVEHWRIQDYKTLFPHAGMEQLIKGRWSHVAGIVQGNWSASYSAFFYWANLSGIKGQQVQLKDSLRWM